MKLIVDIIAGTRPNFVKVAAILSAFRQHTRIEPNWSFRLIHTGQHYDLNMSDTFFSQLKIPAPYINLGVGSGSLAEQTASIMIGYEKLLMSCPSNMCVVVGDVTSTMACAVVAKNFNIPLAHVEAGIRSGDMSMPEEVNRIVTDAISDWFFTTSEVANKNLKLIGIQDHQIHFVGNTMIDTLLTNMQNLRKPSFFDDIVGEKKKYLVLTLHRPANVAEEANVAKIIEDICMTVDQLPLIFPAHPRTAKIIQNIASFPTNLHIVPPQSYLEFNWLVKNAAAVVTDSGGITEEATVMRVPCLTVRDNTERPETITIGTNKLVGRQGDTLKNDLHSILHMKWKKGSTPKYWDGKAGARIIKNLDNILESYVL